MTDRRPAPRSKLLSLPEAAARVADGARVAIGGFAVYQHPMASPCAMPRARRDAARAT